MALTLVLRAMRITPEQIGEPGRQSSGFCAARSMRLRAAAVQSLRPHGGGQSAGRNSFESDAVQLVGPRAVVTPMCSSTWTRGEARVARSSAAPGAAVPVTDQAQIDGP